jgi:DNA-binding CsgD family transcriptional regulator
MTASLLSASYLSIMQAQSADDFRTQIVRFAQDLGFSFVSALTIVDRAQGQPDIVSIDNMPASYRDSGGSADDNKRRDPVMQHCKRDAVPIVWDQATYLRHGAIDVWEEQAAFGYRTGIALALHLPEGRHFMLGVDRDQILPREPEGLTRLVANLQLFAVHAQDAALRLFVPPERLIEAPNLTPRELDALRWTMEGKTAWEVGSILGISERTAVLHIQNAMRKLGSVNKHQAVLKALRLGLLS